MRKFRVSAFSQVDRSSLFCHASREITLFCLSVSAAHIVRGGERRRLRLFCSLLLKGSLARTRTHTLLSTRPHEPYLFLYRDNFSPICRLFHLSLSEKTHNSSTFTVNQSLVFSLRVQHKQPLFRMTAMYTPWLPLTPCVHVGQSDPRGARPTNTKDKHFPNEQKGSGESSWCGCWHE